MNYKTILHEAEQLSLEEQRALVTELISHLSETEEHLLTQEQQKELEHRIRSHREGTGEYSSWDEAKQRIIKRLG